jgi:hypothetical protein
MFPTLNFYPSNNRTFSFSPLISFAGEITCLCGIGSSVRGASGGFRGCSLTRIRPRLKLMRALRFAPIILLNYDDLFISTSFIIIFVNLSHFVTRNHSFCFLICQLMSYRTS